MHKVEPHSSSCFCIPDSPGRVAAVAFAIVLAAAVALTVAITLPQRPDLNNIYYPVFGATLVLAGLTFFMSCVILAKKSCAPKPDPNAIKSM